MRRVIAPLIVAIPAALAALLLLSPRVTAQPVPPPGLRKCTVGSAFEGDCTVASPLELAPQACGGGSAVSGWGSDGTPTCISAGGMGNIATSRILGRVSSGSGAVEELTGTQATTLLDLFSTSSTTKGLVPGSNNDATACLRGDGNWYQCVDNGDRGSITVEDFGSTWVLNEGVVGEFVLADNLDLSGNGYTTLGDVRCKSKEITTTGTINDLALDSDTCTVIFTGGSSITLNGIAGGATDRCIKVKVSTTSNAVLVVSHESGSATNAAYRSVTAGSTSWQLSSNAMAYACYEAADSRWAWSLNQRFPAITVTGGASLIGSTTLGDAATDSIDMGGTLRRDATERQLGANVTGGTGAAWSVAVGGADNTVMGFDADYASSVWTARDTTAYGLAKIGDKLCMLGVTGTSAGTNITSAWSAALASPAFCFDAATGSIVVTGLGTFGALVTTGDAAIGGNFAVTGNTETYGSVLVGDANSDYLNSRGTFAVSGSDASTASANCSVSGEAQSFKVTKSTGGSGTCTVDFNRTFNSAPHCVATLATNKSMTYYVGTSSTTSIIIGFSDSGDINVWCPDRR